MFCVNHCRINMNFTHSWLWMWAITNFGYLIDRRVFLGINIKPKMNFSQYLDCVRKLEGQHA